MGKPNADRHKQNVESGFIVGAEGDEDGDCGHKVLEGKRKLSAV